MWAMFATAFINALQYTVAVCNPLISADNWIFIDTFLRPAIDGRLDLGDFLVKRAGVDHAQPLNKLLMLLNYRLFGLDFAIEGVVGMGFGLAALLVLYRASIADTLSSSRPSVFYALMAAVAAVWFSLNSSMIYSFSLVTMGFAPFFFAFACIWAAWHALEHDCLWPLFLAMAVYGVIGDDSAIIAVLVLTMVSLAWGWRRGCMRQAWRVVSVMVVAVVLCRIFYATFGEIRGATLPVFNVPLGQRVAGLASHWRDAWQWFAIPTTSGVAYFAPLQRLLGAHWQAVQMAMALVLLLAHGWFWRSAWRTSIGATSFVAISLMLLFYAYLTGLLLTRIFVRGADYLNQPRYISFYQLNIIALLVMAAARSLQPDAIGLRRWAAAPVLLLLLVQIPLSLSARREAPYIREYYVQMAQQWAALALDPLHPPAVCAPELALCQMPYARRLAALHFVRDKRINLYSPRFDAAHPQLARAAAPILSIAAGSAPE